MLGEATSAGAAASDYRTSLESSAVIAEILRLASSAVEKHVGPIRTMATEACQLGASARSAASAVILEAPASHMLFRKLPCVKRY